LTKNVQKLTKNRDNWNDECNFRNVCFYKNGKWKKSVKIGQNQSSDCSFLTVLTISFHYQDVKYSKFILYGHMINKEYYIEAMYRLQETFERDG